jgi:hypothetical protein
MEEDDESYSTAMGRILKEARGPLEEIEEFDTSEPTDTEPAVKTSPSTPTEQPAPAKLTQTTPKTAPKTTPPAATDRLALLRMAAMMAVLSMSNEAPARSRQVGRRRGTAWAQDHRLAAMGLPGLAHSTTRRATWR